MSLTSSRNIVVDNDVEVVLSFWLEVQRRPDANLTGSSSCEFGDVIIVAGGRNQPKLTVCRQAVGTEQTHLAQITIRP